MFHKVLKNVSGMFKFSIQKYAKIFHSWYIQNDVLSNLDGDIAYFFKLFR